MAVDASHQNAILSLFQEEHIASEVHEQPDHGQICSTLCLCLAC